MSLVEVDRVAVIRDVVEKRLRQDRAAERLRVRVRQVQRLAARCRRRGAAGLISGHRGKRSNRAIGDGFFRGGDGGGAHADVAHVFDGARSSRGVLLGPPRRLPGQRERSRGRVSQAKERQRSRPNHKPAPDHPWRRGCDARAADRVAAG